MRRLPAVAILIVMLMSTALAGSASADVFLNVRGPATFGLFNPCAPDDGLVTLDGEIHTVGRTTQDGTTIFQNNGHFTGASSGGTRYEVTVISVFTDPPGPEFRSTVMRVTISQGDSGNHRIELTFTTPPPSSTTTSACHG